MAQSYLSAYTARLYSFDDVQQKFIMNPESDAELTSLTGWDNTALSVSELSDAHNGATVFTGRSDYAGDPQLFPIMVLVSGGVVSNPTQFKVRVDRDPNPSYDGQDTFSKESVGTSVNVDIDVYKDEIYATTFQYTADFDNDDFRQYQYEVQYTDPDTNRTGSFTLHLNYIEFQGPKILELDSNDVSSGQVPKLNTLTDIAVKWLNGSNVEQNDTEAVVAHTNATNVVVTRETTATATYSHKTGLPIPTLLYYRDDVGTRVDFNGTYEIPDTVVNQPITFGWSITNGNVVGEVEQTEFTQTLTADSANDVIMPTFTDDWGNSATLASRTKSVQYGSSGLQPRNYWKMDADVAGEIVDEMGNDNLTIAGAPVIDSNGMFINSSSAGAYTDGVSSFCPSDSDWSFEYSVKLASGANIFSGNFNIGKKANWPYFMGMRYGGNDVSSVLYGKQHSHTSDDRVTIWKTNETVIPVILSYNSTTGKCVLSVNGESYSDLATSTDIPPYNEFQVGMQSSDNTTFTPSTTACTNYTFSEIKYYTEQIL